MTPTARRAGLAAAAAFAAFTPALSGDFLLDDAYYVVTNQALVRPAAWWRLWTDPSTLLSHPAFAGQAWRPAAAQYFALMRWAGGLNPFWFHLGDAALHALNAALVAALAARLWGPAAALPAALLFALHPAQAEAAGYIGDTPGLLAAFGVLAALSLHAGGRRRSAAAAGAFALLCRESSAVLPLLVAAWDRAAPPEDVRRRGWAPHAAVVGGYLVLRRLALGTLAQRGLWGGTPLRHALFALGGLGRDLLIAFRPSGLRACYSPGGGLLAAAAAALALGALGAAAAGLLLFRKRSGFALALFLAPLLPVSNLVPIDALAADRFLYMPLAGLGLLWGGLLSRVKAPRRAAAVLALALACLPTLLEGQLAWRGQFQLDLAAYAAAPGDPCAGLALSSHYFNWWMLERSESLAREAERAEAPPNIIAEARRVQGLCAGRRRLRAGASSPRGRAL